MEIEIIDRLRATLKNFGYPEDALKINPRLSGSTNYQPDAVLEVNKKVIAVFEVKDGKCSDRNLKIQFGVFDIDIPVFLVTLDNDIRIRRVLPDGSLVDSNVRELSQENLQKYYTNKIIEKDKKVPNGSPKVQKVVYSIFHLIALFFLISLIMDIIYNSPSTCWMSIFSEIARFETLIWSILILVLILIPGYVYNKPIEKRIIQALRELMMIFSNIKY